MQNLLLVLPHSSTELLLRRKYLESPAQAASIQFEVQCMYCMMALTQLQGCSYLGFSCKDSTHVVSPCDFESVFAVVHVYVHVCVRGFYVHDLIPQCAKHLQRWPRGRASECPHARARHRPCTRCSPSPIASLLKPTESTLSSFKDREMLFFPV